MEDNNYDDNTIENKSTNEEHSSRSEEPSDPFHEHNDRVRKSTEEKYSFVQVKEDHNYDDISIENQSHEEELYLEH